MLQEIREIGTHAVAIYDYLVAGLGNRWTEKKSPILSLILLAYPMFTLSSIRSKNQGLLPDAESYSHVFDIAVLLVLCTVPGPSPDGQSQALPAEGSHDSLQLLFSGPFNIHRLRSRSPLVSPNILFVIMFDVLKQRS